MFISVCQARGLRWQLGLAVAGADLSRLNRIRARIVNQRVIIETTPEVEHICFIYFKFTDSEILLPQKQKPLRLEEKMSCPYLHS